MEIIQILKNLFSIFLTQTKKKSQTNFSTPIYRQLNLISALVSGCIQHCRKSLKMTISPVHFYVLLIITPLFPAQLFHHLWHTALSSVTCAI